jgi:hypothetical protein
VPIWRASERESSQSSQSKRERGEESWAWSEPKGRPIHFQHRRHTSLSVCRSHTSCIPPYRYCIPNTSRCLPPPPLGKERATLRTARPPIAQGSSLRDPLSRATTTRREANRCTIIALLFIPPTPAVTRLDVLTALLTTTLAASWKALDHLAHRRRRLSLIRQKEEPLAPASKPLARLNYHLADLLH